MDKYWEGNSIDRASIQSTPEGDSEAFGGLGHKIVRVDSSTIAKNISQGRSREVCVVC